MTLSVTELTEWQEYYRLEPFMADRQELQMSRIGHIIGGFAGCKLQKDDLLISDYGFKKEDKQKELAKKLLAVFGG